MNLAFLKTRTGRIVLILIVLGVVALCVGGVVIGGVVNEQASLPLIVLAAEEIPLPFSLPVFGNHIPNTLPSTWLTMIILILVAWSYSRRVQGGKQASRFVTAMDALGEGMLGFMRNAVGEKATLFFPLVATFFLFIAINNWCGILPGFGSVGVWAVHQTEEAVVAEAAAHDEHAETEAGDHDEHDEHLELVPFFRSANAHLSTTVALAVISVGAAQYFGFKAQGRRYLDKYLNFRASSPKPDPATQQGLQGAVSKAARGVEIVVNGGVGLIEIVLEALKVLPFSFRLFGNIFAGEVLLFVVSYLFAFVFPIIFLGLELFVGLIQGLIFAMLSLVFFSIASTSHHGEESHH
jgi:F-type H+-transporting ATPase subunit a